MLVELADKGAAGLRVVKWQHTLDEKWATLHFGEMKVETRGEQHVFEVQVCLNDPGGTFTARLCLRSAHQRITRRE